MKTNETKIRVYYADTDAGGVAYYASYLRWFEIGRTEILRQQGIDWADIEKKENLLAPVVRVECDYKHPVMNNDLIVIKTSIERVGNSSITFSYEILGEKDKNVLAKGISVNVFVDKKTMKSVHIPKYIREKIK